MGSRFKSEGVHHESSDLKGELDFFISNPSTILLYWVEFIGPLTYEQHFCAHDSLSYPVPIQDFHLFAADHTRQQLASLTLGESVESSNTWTKFQFCVLEVHKIDNVRSTCRCKFRLPGRDVQA